MPRVVTQPLPDHESNPQPLDHRRIVPPRHPWIWKREAERRVLMETCCTIQTRQQHRAAGHCASHSANLSDISARDVCPIFPFSTGELAQSQSLEHLLTLMLPSQQRKERPNSRRRHRLWQLHRKNKYFVCAFLQKNYLKILY